MLDDYIRKVDKVIRVLDGDTVELRVDLGFHTYHVSKFRLAGFDAPETWRPSTIAEKDAGEKVTKFLEDLLYEYKGRLGIQTSSDPEIYGRYVAVIFVVDPEHPVIISINKKVECFMIENGLTKEQIMMYNKG